jgi:hypothetical protein
MRYFKLSLGRSKMKPNPSLQPTPKALRAMDSLASLGAAELELKHGTTAFVLQAPYPEILECLRLTDLRPPVF